MKLRFVEREISIPIYGYGPDVAEVKKVRILQYWDALSDDNWTASWVDVPLEVEEKNA